MKFYNFGYLFLVQAGEQSETHRGKELGGK